MNQVIQSLEVDCKNLSREEVKALNNLVKNKDFVIQKAGKGNNIVILNRSDYISKPTKVLEDTSKFKRVNIEEGKALNHLIHTEERTIRLFKSLEDPGEILKKKKMIYIHQVLNQEFCKYGLVKIHKPLEDGIPSFRPILLAIETPTYKLAKFCDQLLKQ